MEKKQIKNKAEDYYKVENTLQMKEKRILFSRRKQTILCFREKNNKKPLENNRIGGIFFLA